jgi:hypothetical protein
MKNKSLQSDTVLAPEKMRPFFILLKWNALSQQILSEEENNVKN